MLGCRVAENLVYTRPKNKTAKAKKPGAHARKSKDTGKRTSKARDQLPGGSTQRLHRPLQ